MVYYFVLYFPEIPYRLLCGMGFWDTTYFLSSRNFTINFCGSMEEKYIYDHQHTIQFKIGDRAVCISTGGFYQEYHTFHDCPRYDAMFRGYNPDQGLQNFLSRATIFCGSCLLYLKYILAHYVQGIPNSVNILLFQTLWFS